MVWQNDDERSVLRFIPCFFTGAATYADMALPAAKADGSGGGRS